MIDLFGRDLTADPLLRDKFIEPPFSVLDTKTGSWQNRKRLWMSKGIKSEVGRGDDLAFTGAAKSFDYYRVKEGKKAETKEQGTSIFDPALCEVIYHWFCPEGGRILDPFAGGSVRGIVANYLGYKYTGIELRPEQVDSNRVQAAEILPVNNQPEYFIGDSNKVLNMIGGDLFDFLFTCPPYVDLEVYSDLPEDLSNMDYRDFYQAYEAIIYKSCNLLRPGCYAAIVVGEVRDKNGDNYGFVPDTIIAFQNAGMKYYNEAILLNPVASASMRANGTMKYQKLVKIHQNVLIFRKPK